ncbi:MAG TPA: DUF433 domain-containing protein [Methylomirabilota bacterium]|jgi:uncharacterized protein (DUF433 family)|nr:DUF433 domain-containing protein [Methylomirabilota bacterium]
MKARKRREFGQHIISDPEICHGHLTFKGTRMLVKDVLYFVAQGYDWNTISKEFYGLPREAIAEAIDLACRALLEKTEKQIERRKRAA